MRHDIALSLLPRHVCNVFSQSYHYIDFLVNTLRHASAGGEEFHLEDFDRYEWAGEVDRLYSAGRK